MNASSKPPCRAHVRANITLQVPPELAIELDETARRHNSTRHRLIIRMIQEGLERLPVSGTVSQS